MSLALPITLTFNKRQVGGAPEKTMQVDALDEASQSSRARAPSGATVTVSFRTGAEAVGGVERQREPGKQAHGESAAADPAPMLLSPGGLTPQ